MKVLLLGQHSRLLLEQLQSHDVVHTDSKLSQAETHAIGPEVIVSFGYRFILPGEILQLPKFGAINIHISLLPWNRGSDPNFWSWLENTPKGVTTHRMTEKLDQGSVIAQSSLEMDSSLTLRQSYQQLLEAGAKMFPTSLDSVLSGEAGLKQFEEAGTYHSSSQFAQYSFLLAENGWDTSGLVIQEFGRDNGLWRI